jgi:LysR family transcriptional activator of nhaA
MRTLNYHHLRYFHAVAHTGNLTRAAERLHVSPSALSVQIQRLEEQLGHKLFRRSGRTLVLTEAGRIAHDRAEAIFAAGDELVSSLRDVATTQLPTLRLGASATLSRNFQIAFLEPLIGRRDARVTLRSGSLRELLQMLEALQIDVLLTNTLPARSERSTWAQHLIAEQPVSLIGRPRRSRKPPGLDALLGAEPLIVPPPENHLRGAFDALMDRMGQKPHIVAEVDDMAMVRLLTREGAGLAVVPPIVVRDELKSAQLHDYGRLPGLKETFYAITAKRRFPNPLLARLIAPWRRR